jgi:hypothetical protein
VAFDLAVNKKVRRSITNSGSWSGNDHRAQNGEGETASKRDSRLTHEQPVALTSKLSDRCPRPGYCVEQNWDYWNLALHCCGR